MPAPKSAPKRRKPAASEAKSSATAKTATKSNSRSRAKSKSDAATPIEVVVLTREWIQETLDDAARRGRVTRHDANELAAALIRKGRQQTDDVRAELERQLSRGRDQIGSATRKARRSEPVDRIVRTADRARRTVGVGPSFPIIAYDDLTANQVTGRLGELRPADLRKVRDYERKHANRKSVLDAIEKALP
jgi:polyhydroxyalkanoate synthesis regulator phasin